LYYGGEFEKDTWYGRTPEEEKKCFLNSLPVREGDFVLNAGFGNHTLLAALSDIDAHFVGIDIHDKFDIVKQTLANHANIKLVKTDILNMPFKKETFDHIWCSGVLHHNENPRKCFDKLVSVLKKNGHIYILVYTTEFSPYLELRKIFKNSYKLSDKNLLRLSYLLAALISIPVLAKRMIKKGKFHFKQIVFSTYDSLSPRYLYRIPEQEIKKWFEENNLTFKKQGRWEYVGRKF